MAYQVGGVKGGSGVAYPQLKSSSFVFDPANSKLVNMRSEPGEMVEPEPDYMQWDQDQDQDLTEEFEMATAAKLDESEIDEDFNAYSSSVVLNSIFEPDSDAVAADSDILDSIFTPRAEQTNTPRIKFNEEVIECNFYKAEPVTCIGEAVRAADPNTILTNIFN